MSDKLTLADNDLQTVVTFLHNHMRTAGRFCGSANYTDKLMVFCDDWWMRLGDDQATTQPENLRRKLEWFFNGDQATVLPAYQLLSLLHATCYHMANNNLHDKKVDAIVDKYTHALNIIYVSDPPAQKIKSGPATKLGGTRFTGGSERKTGTYSCQILG